jgi:hypothetical protein
MTNREFFVSISAGNLTDECIAHAVEALSKMDATNAKRKDKPSKVQEANAPIKQALIELLTANPNTKYTENELGVALDITHNKAGSLARQLVAEGKAVSAEVKIAKVGKRKVYSIAIEE